MKAPFFSFVTAIITSTAIAASIYLASLSNPTDLQRQLSTTTNTISIAGTTTIFGLLDNDLDDKNSDL